MKITHRSSNRSSRRFTTALAGLAAAAALLLAPTAPQAHAAKPGNSKDVPKVQGTLLTTPPPADAEVLFDGTAATAAANWNPAGKLWPILEGGIWEVRGNDVLTKKSYGSCQIHLEWRVPAKHKNTDAQKAGNSGVLFHSVTRDKKSASGWYEIQILESFDNTGTYADGMAGAVYLHNAPTVNPSFPRDQWQSYDITFTAPKFDAAGKVTAYPRFTVIFNGVKVQDDVELRSTTRTRGNAKPGQFKAHPVKQPIVLQNHKDPVQFRNIWVKDLEPAPTPATPANPADADATGVPAAK